MESSSKQPPQQPPGGAHGFLEYFDPEEEHIAKRTLRLKRGSSKPEVPPASHKNPKTPLKQIIKEEEEYGAFSPEGKILAFKSQNVDVKYFKFSHKKTKQKNKTKTILNQLICLIWAFT